jgi:hypothetical protein
MLTEAVPFEANVDPSSNVVIVLVRTAFLLFLSIKANSKVFDVILWAF